MSASSNLIQALFLLKWWQIFISFFPISSNILKLEVYKLSLMIQTAEMYKESAYTRGERNGLSAVYISELC